MESTKLPEETVARRLQCQRWGGCDAGTADRCGGDLKTVHRCQHVAAQRAQARHARVARDLRVAAGHLDERHSKRRGPPGEWRQTARAMRRRFVLWVHWGARTQDSAALRIAQVVARRCGLPGWLRDGGKADPAALMQVLGQGYRRRRRGRRGRYPKPRLGPPRDLGYGPVVKVRQRQGKLLRGISRVVDGGPRRFITEMASGGRRPSIQPAFMARGSGPRRALGAPRRRRTRCRSTSPRRHRARVWPVVDLSNFGLPPKSLRQEGRPRTPAMAIGVASQAWSSQDYIWYPVPPAPLDRQLMPQRVKDLLVPALVAG